MRFSYLLFSLFIGVMIFGVAQSVYADVIINEIAWMGTTTSANDEWIELFNNGTNSVSIEGWTLKASDGSPTVNLSGNIPAGAYTLLERTDDTTVPGVTAGVIYSGALSNSGEDLVLKNNTDQTVDSVLMSSGWVGGNATTKETMQRKNSGWVTGIGTPGAVNITGSTSNTNDTDPSDTTDNSTTPSDRDEETTIYIRPDSTYSSQMIIPDIIIQETPARFESIIKKDKGLVSLGGRFEWSMGDGGSFVYDRSTSFDYTYHHPGNYIVTLRYYSDAFLEKPDAIHRKTITVIPASISIHIDKTTGILKLTNQSTDNIDLGHWKIKSDNDLFTFPVDTIIPKNETLIIPYQIHLLKNWFQQPTLTTPTGYIVPKNPQSLYQIKSSSSGNDIFTNDLEKSETSENLFSKSVDLTNQKTIGLFSNKNTYWIFPFIILLIISTFIFNLISNAISEKTDSVVKE